MASTGRLSEQVRDGMVRPPVAVARLSARGWRLAGLYLLLAVAVLGGVAALLAATEQSLRRFVFSSVLPLELEVVADFLVQHIFRSQAREVLASASVSGSLVVVSLTLFRVKERLSQSVERDADLLAGEPFDELPMRVEAFEELKLLLLYIASFFAIFALGHGPEPWRDVLASVASTLFVFFTYAVDFGAPLMIRHGVRYSQIIAAVFRRPVAAFGFGAVFSAPALLTARLVAASPDLDPGVALGIVFGVNVLTIVWAAAGGAWLGARLLPVARAARPARAWLVAVTWAALLAILAAGVWISLAVAGSLQAKSQILKCVYDVDWASVRVDKPDLGGLLGGEVAVGIGFDVTIDNPTSVAVEIEDNRLELSDSDGLVLARGALTPLTVAAGERVTPHVALTARLEATSLLRGASLDPRRWRITLYLQVAEDFELPVYLKRAP